MNKKINLKALEKVKDITKNIYHNYFSISAIKEITTNDYSLKKVIPLDMFPHTPNVENIISLEKN